VGSGDEIELAQGTLESPLGVLRLAVTSRGLVKVGFPGGPRSDFHGWLRLHVPEARRVSSLPALDEVRDQLREYIAGTRQVFKLPLDLRGTVFQKRVWEYMGTIPYGMTRSYGDVARDLGRPGASRAVGAASGANPLPIVLPCHRVVGASGRMGGFGGGLEAKRFLLALEQRALPPLLPS